MTENANRILESFDRLDPVEQHAVVVSLLKRGGELPLTPLADNDLCDIAEELFSSLDDEEDGSSSQTR